MSARLLHLAALPLLLLALALPGCAGQGTGRIAGPAAIGNAVPPEPQAPPRLAEKRLVAADGVELPLRVFLPEGKLRAALVALHGMNDYSNSFTVPARQWAKEGIATYAYDQRGFGEAPERGRWAGTWQLDADAATAVALVRARHPGVPVYLLGESMGGAVAITAVTGIAGAPRPDVDGIILAAPAVWGRETMNPFERAALWTAYEVMPGMTLTGRGLKIKPSDNIGMLRALARDPLVIKATRVDTLKGLVDLMDAALGAAPRVRTPMLLLYGDRDEIIPQEATRRWIAGLPPAGARDRRIAWYPEGYHMVLRDLEGPLVWRDVASWIADRAAPLPSGADGYARRELVARN
jgi:alpha-beta hydrolase superfamily lysophospholipase